MIYLASFEISETVLSASHVDTHMKYILCMLDSLVYAHCEKRKESLGQFGSLIITKLNGLFLLNSCWYMV